MEIFADQLLNLIQEKRSIVYVGLDPRFEGNAAIPAFLLKETESNYNDAIWRFNQAIIDATIDYTPVYKPQSAFYEQYDALDALKKTIAYIHEKGALVILDAKRNDIGPTCDAYASAAFKLYDADALTVNSYLGIDGVAPFLKYFTEGKGLFLLLKTSNKSSGDFQDLFTIAEPDLDPKTTEVCGLEGSFVRNYIMITRLMRKWSENTTLIGMDSIVGEKVILSLGGVVGATYPEQLQSVRLEAPQNLLLIPGYGPQGGTAQDIVQGINENGYGAIVNSSRGIIFAYGQTPYNENYSVEQYDQAAKQAVEEMRNAINSALEEAGKLKY